MKQKTKDIIQTIKWFGPSYYLPRCFQRSWDNLYWNKIRPIFAPQHKRYRKVIPKTWVDLTELIVISNLEFIKGFYEDEFLQDRTDWNSTEQLKKFSRWLKAAYKYVTVERPKLQQDIDNAYPDENWEDAFEKITDEDGIVRWYYKDKRDPKKVYKEKYGKLERLEKKLEEKDTKIITEMVAYRGYFWT